MTDTTEVLALSLPCSDAGWMFSQGEELLNLSWGTDHRGPLVIHASEEARPPSLYDPDPLGYAGVAYLAGAHHADTCRLDEPRYDWHPFACSYKAKAGRWHWRLQRARVLLPPIPGPGQAGLWRPPQTVIDAITEPVPPPGQEAYPARQLEAGCWQLTCLNGHQVEPPGGWEPAHFPDRAAAQADLEQNRFDGLRDDGTCFKCGEPVAPRQTVPCWVRACADCGAEGRLIHYDSPQEVRENWFDDEYDRSGVFDVAGRGICHQCHRKALCSSTAVAST